MLTFLVIIAVFSILIFVHELGHFSVAKKIGIQVEEFGFGLPPRIWGKKIRGTTYSINWLPIGGFVRLLGEDEHELARDSIDEKKRKKYFWARSKKERAAVLLAGVVMNFLLAVLIISYIFTQGVYVPTDRVHIEDIASQSPAETSGLQKGDVIVTFHGQKIETTEDLIKTTQERLNKATQMMVLRDDQQVALEVTPRKDYPEGEGPMGVVISNLEEKKFPLYAAPFLGTIEALKMSYMMLAALAQIIFGLVTFRPVSFDIAGPIGIAQATSKAVQTGFMAVMQLTGILSLNLALINLFPIPALDGGRLMFVIFEKFLGRKVQPRVERIAHQIGLAFLLVILALITVNDILRWIRG